MIWWQTIQYTYIKRPSALYISYVSQKYTKDDQLKGPAGDKSQRIRNVTKANEIKQRKVVIESNKKYAQVFSLILPFLLFHVYFTLELCTPQI